MRTVTARVEARVIDKDRLDKNKNKSSTGDGRTDGGGKWTVGGTLAWRTTYADAADA